MVSYVCKTTTGRLYPSLGAVRYFLMSSLSSARRKYNRANPRTSLPFDPQSGAVMAVLAAVCTKVPEAKLGIIFLPMVTFTAGSVSGSLRACVCVWYCIPSLGTV